MDLILISETDLEIWLPLASSIPKLNFKLLFTNRYFCFNLVPQHDGLVRAPSACALLASGDA